MFAQLVAAVGVLAVLTVTPGPDMAVVTRRTLAASRGDGLRTAGGIAVGLLVWGLLAVVGLAAVLAASDEAYLAVRVLGAAYLVLLGVQAFRGDGHVGDGPADGSPATGGAWRAGLVNNMLNPKIAVFYTGLLPSLAPARLPAAVGMGLLVLVHAALTVGWLGGYVYLISRARSVFERPRVRRILARVTGLVLIAFGVRIAVDGLG